MGGSIGASLVRAGKRVLFVDVAGDHVEAMNGRGLRITGPVEDFLIQVEATRPEALQGRFPLVFLCVKAHHTRSAASQIEPHLAEQGVVVSIQNGLCERDIAQVVGAARTVGAFVNFGADYLEPGVIHRGNRGAVVVGELNGEETRRVRQIHDVLKLFEPSAVLTDNIFGYLWGKLSYAALLFATALTNAPIADVLAASEHRPLLRALAREVIAVAQARGIEPESFDGFNPRAFRPQGYPEDADRSLDDLVVFNRASAKTHSGIWRDLAVRKRPTEVDAQLGAVVEIAGEEGMTVPLIERLVVQIHEIERGERKLAMENLDELAEGLGQDGPSPPETEGS
jgi:2-dehydropantoate 2-reductase